MLAVGRRLALAASLPERLVRAIVAVAGGTVHETAELVMPRLVRRSRLYEATAKNALRLLVELVGGVDDHRARAAAEYVPDPRQLLKRKAAGNVVELGSIAAFGFSPLWLLAAASDIARGSRIYLQTLVDELKAAGVLAREAHVASIDELLGALEGASGGTARLIDIPPLELAQLRESLADLRGHAESLPSPGELARVYEGLRLEAERERRSLLEVSTGAGLAFLLSARRVAGEQVISPYREDWRPVADEGFAAYARRVARPYGEAVASRFDAERESLTERGLERLRRRP